MSAENIFLMFAQILKLMKGNRNIYIILLWFL